MGLPTVSLALLTMAINLHSAMALLLIPSFVTNVWQALVGGHTTAVLIRIWPFLLTATVTVWVGSLALARLEPAWLSGLLGVLVITYATVNLAGIRIRITKKHDSWSGPVLGLINGILTGMTGSFVVPGVMYLQAIDLPREALIQAMGMLFTVSTIALAVALQQNQLLSSELGALSLASVIPAIIGMWLGQRLRKRLSEQQFRRVFFISLLVLGGAVFAQAVA